MGAFMIFYLEASAEEVEKKFSPQANNFIGYRDISKTDNDFKITVQDCWRALYFMKQRGLFDINHFDRKTYKFYSLSINGDLNWIVPNQILAFSSPLQSEENSEKSFLSVKDYSIVLKQFEVKSIVRLNSKEYDESLFIQEGF